MYYIGVDLGGTSIKVGLVSSEGLILERVTSSTPVEDGFEGIVEEIKKLSEEVIKRKGFSKEEIKGMGVGIPGVANQEGLVYNATNLFWINVPLGEKLREATGLQVFVENDATVAAVAEYSNGVSVGTSNSIFLTLGTGLGGGLIINGKVYSGSHGIGTEMGHMVIGENFYNCNCGNNGCWETYSSATAMINHCKKLLAEGNQSIILEKANGDLNKISAKMIFDCFSKGDEVAKMVIDRMVDYLAKGIGNLINIFDPEVIAIGGGVSGGGHLFIDQLKKKIKNYIYVKEMNVTKIVIAKLGNDAGIIGSSMLAKMKLEEG